jgi:hypothetical protein
MLRSCATLPLVARPSAGDPNPRSTSWLLGLGAFFDAQLPVSKMDAPLCEMHHSTSAVCCLERRTGRLSTLERRVQNTITHRAFRQTQLLRAHSDLLVSFLLNEWHAPRAMHRHRHRQTQTHTNTHTHTHTQWNRQVIPVCSIIEASKYINKQNIMSSGTRHMHWHKGKKPAS